MKLRAHSHLRRSTAASTQRTRRQAKLRDMLVAEKQEHLYKDWKASDTKEQRKAFYDQIATLDNAYPAASRPTASTRDC